MVVLGAMLMLFGVGVEVMFTTSIEPHECLSYRCLKLSYTLMILPLNNFVESVAQGSLTKHMS